MLGARPGEGEWSAAGDVLNTAARIQSAAPTDGILVSRTTYLATKESFAFNAAEPIQAKGKTEPVEVWEVVGAEDQADARPRSESPLVGRDAELAELMTFADSVAEERSAGLAAILGMPGIGKSRLLHELVNRLEGRFAVHWGSASPTARGSPTGPSSRSSCRRPESCRATTARRARRSSTRSSRRFPPTTSTSCAPSPRRSPT